MAAFYTIKRLYERLGAFCHVDLPFIDALNEIGEYAYTISKWPYSETHFKVAAADIFQEVDSGGAFDTFWFVRIDAELYDGARKFRVNGTGYEIASFAEEFDRKPRGWNRFIDHGEEVDSAGASEKRVYRCPGGIDNTDEIHVWVKKRWVDLYDDGDDYPIRSISAIRKGIYAMNYEVEGDIQKSEAMWNRFEATLLRDERQYHGPKRAFVKFQSPFNNKPRSFR